MVDDAIPDPPVPETELSIKKKGRPKGSKNKVAVSKEPTTKLMAHVHCIRCSGKAALIYEGPHPGHAPLVDLFDSGQLEEGVTIQQASSGDLSCRNCGIDVYVEHWSGKNHRFYPNNIVKA